MNISVFGLGYVGCVSAALLAKMGHHVIGVDVNPLKVQAIRDGESPILEPGLKDIVAETHRDGRLTATDSADDAIANSQLSLIAVGTPSRDNGSLELRAVKAVVQDIAGALTKANRRGHTIVLRSTVLPGTTQSFVAPILERHGLRVGEDVGLCFNPEFLREGTSVADFHAPPFTVIGSDDGAGDKVAALYAGIDAPIIRVALPVAEMVKYTCNAFHAMKITFANEIGRFCRAQGIDSHEVMDIVCRDTKLNISPAYLKPGFAFGGSCLPKDLRALLYRAKESDIELPMLSQLLPSNEMQVDLAMNIVSGLNKRKVSILGLSFKGGTDDVRESPTVALAERLIGKGYEVRIYDRDVSLSRLVGANQEYLQRQIPHIMSILAPDLDAVVDHGDVLVVGANGMQVRHALETLPEEKSVVDLIRVFQQPSAEPRYCGIAW